VSEYGLNDPINTLFFRRQVQPYVFSDPFPVKIWSYRQDPVLSPNFICHSSERHPYDSLPHPWILCCVLYADDILLIAPSSGELQNLFRSCELQLSWLNNAY